jgi:predicted DNA-binding transcriptional regulator AlpA
LAANPATGSLKVSEAMRKSKASTLTPAQPVTAGRTLLFKPQVLSLFDDIAASTLWSWMDTSGFPRPIVLGPEGKRTATVAWFADEIDDWIAKRPRRQLREHKFHGRRVDTTTEQPTRRRSKTPASTNA